MSRTSKYTEEQRKISNRYSSIKNRVSYPLEDYWKRDDIWKIIGKEMTLLDGMKVNPKYVVITNVQLKN